MRRLRRRPLGRSTRLERGGGGQLAGPCATPAERGCRQRCLRSAQSLLKTALPGVGGPMAVPCARPAERGGPTGALRSASLELKIDLTTWGAAVAGPCAGRPSGGGSRLGPALGHGRSTGLARGGQPAGPCAMPAERGGRQRCLRSAQSLLKTDLPGVGGRCWRWRCPTPGQLSVGGRSRCPALGHAGTQDRSTDVGGSSCWALRRPAGRGGADGGALRSAKP